MQWSRAGVVMVDAQVVDNSKHQETSWHNLACISFHNYSLQAGPASESG